MRKNLRRHLRDIVGGLGGVWLLTFAAVFLNPHPHLLPSLGFSPAILATLMAAGAGLIVGVVCSVCALLRFVRRCARRSV